MNMPSLAAVVINDHQFVTDLLDGLLQAHGVKIVRAFAEPQAALPQIIMNPPGLVIVDMMLPSLRTIKGEQVQSDHPYVLMDSQIAVHAVRQIRDRCPSTKILMISGERHPHTFVLGFEAGAHGIASKLDGSGSFLEVLRRVLNGEEGVTSARMQRVLQEYASLPRPELTELEVHILELAQEGMECPQIARRLGYAPKTIRNYVSDINRKLGTSNRYEAVEIAIEMGLLGWRLGYEGD